MKDCAIQSISLIFMTVQTHQVYFPSPPSFLAPNFLGLRFSLLYGSMQIDLWQVYCIRNVQKFQKNAIKTILQYLPYHTIPLYKE